MTKNLKKLYSILLAVVMVLSVFGLSITAYAADDVIPTLQLDVAQTVTIDEAGKTVVYAFTAPTTDVYAFEAYADTESEDELDNVGVLLDSQLNTVAADDDSGKGYNFYLAYSMTAGETYYLGIAFYDETVTGSFDVEAKLSDVIDVNFGSVTIDEYDPERYDENFDYNEETGEYDLAYNYYFYDDLVPYEIVLRDGTRLTGVGSSYEYEGEYNYIDHYDSQGYGSEWVGGKTYEVVFSAFGFMEIWDVTVVGEIKTGWQYDGQGWYFNDSNGNKVTNCWMADSNGWCYLGVDGYMVTNSWVMDSVGWCYLGSDGYCVTNCWMADSIGWCYLDAEGRMVTNQWVKDSVGWCYIGADGYMLTNSWVKDSVGWCFVDENGYMVYDVWVYDGVGICYINSNGYMVSNQWVKDIYGWTYYGADGYLITNQWIEDSVGWCYVGSDGYMVKKQWIQDSQGWCYVGSDGYCVKNAFIRDSVGICYLNGNGRMVTSSWITVDGRRYYIDADGHVVTGRVVIDGVTYNLLGPFEALEPPTYKPYF